MPTQARNGVPCPNCGQTIEVTLEGLLSRGRFICANPTCRTEIRLDASRSSDALDAARTLKAGLDEAERMKPDGAR